MTTSTRRTVPLAARLADAEAYAARAARELEWACATGRPLAFYLTACEMAERTVEWLREKRA